MSSTVTLSKLDFVVEENYVNLRTFGENTCVHITSK